MAVQVWVGEKPEHPNERRAIVALANGLDRLEDLYVMLVNFNVGGRTIDLAVIKHDAIFIIELKHCDGILEGGVNGPWYLTNANGERKEINPGRSNPYNQVISCYYSLTNFLKEHRTAFLSEHHARTINFRSCRRVVAIAPIIQTGSQLDIDWKVEVKGLAELPSFLVTERSAEIELTEEEMVAIPELLQCTRWQDVNQLLAGVLPYWNGEEKAAQQQQQQQQQQSANTEQTMSDLLKALLQRMQVSLSTTAGRLALAMSVLTLLLLVLLVANPFATRTPQEEPIAQQSLVYATSGPAGGLFAGSTYREETRCLWTEFQPVGKRWDEHAQTWISVGVDGIMGDMSPQVVVTLEKVDYCGEQIIFFWSVRNNSDAPVLFPLDNDNITIRDPLGNSYPVDHGASEPRQLYVKAGEQKRGTMVVPQPPVQDVPSLLVRLREKPFGEASWLVSLQHTR